MHELQITMLGPSGVGKTTLLTAMYEQFESNIGSVDLQLTPDEDSSAILQDTLIDLKSLLDSFEVKGGVLSTEAPAGPDSLRSFTFGLGKKGKKPSLTLTFRDYPGIYHTKMATTDEKRFLRDLIVDSHVILIAIDTPSLMEQNGKYHEKINRPQQIKDLFKNAYSKSDDNEPKMVIFAPVKCEKYLKKNLNAELEDAVKKGYQDLFEYFRSDGLSNWTSCVLTPVQTVGNVVLSRIEPDENGVLHFSFRKTRYDATYDPKDSEQPLRYLLRFLLKIHLDSRKWSKFNFVRDWLKMDRHLEKAVDEFSRGCKTGDGFTILQGESWLKI
ncbi:MAG: TRAFAC clade GTPase domain-containing protein [Thainema sp.]